MYNNAHLWYGCGEGEVVFGMERVNERSFRITGNGKAPSDEGA